MSTIILCYIAMLVTILVIKNFQKVDIQLKKPDYHDLEYFKNQFREAENQAEQCSY